MKDPMKYTFNDLYEVTHERGKSRFGDQCKHETVKKGRCINCFRKVRTKKPTL